MAGYGSNTSATSTARPSSAERMAATTTARESRPSFPPVSGFDWVRMQSAKCSQFVHHDIHAWIWHRDTGFIGLLVIKAFIPIVVEVARGAVNVDEVRPAGTRKIAAHIPLNPRHELQDRARHIRDFGFRNLSPQER